MVEFGLQVGLGVVLASRARHVSFRLDKCLVLRETNPALDLAPGRVVVHAHRFSFSMEFTSMLPRCRHGRWNFGELNENRILGSRVVMSQGRTFWMKCCLFIPTSHQTRDGGVLQSLPTFLLPPSLWFHTNHIKFPLWRPRPVGKGPSSFRGFKPRRSCRSF